MQTIGAYICIYRVDCLNLGVAKNAFESEYDLLPVRRREGQMSTKKNIMLITKNKCNVIANFLNPTKHAKLKNSHLFPILNIVMNTRKRKENFITSKIMLERDRISTVLMNNLTSQIKRKNQPLPSGKLRPGSS